MMKKAIAPVLLAILLAGGGYLHDRLGAKKAPPYRTVAVDRGDVAETVSATGTINAVTTVQVGSQVSGTIREILVDFNSRVKKGQIIARIDPQRFRADLTQAQGTLANAMASLEKAEVAVADTERTLRRNRELFAEGFVPEADVDAAQAARDSALAQRKIAEGQLLQARGGLSSSETDLAYTTITSPVNGVVISRNVDVGQTVAASFQTPTLFTIAQDLTRMQIDTNVDEADIGRTREGQHVTFTVDAWPEKTFEGKVVQVRNAATVTQNVVTYNVVVQVDNRELLLKPGMTANVSILVRKEEDVLRIPNAALRYRPDEKKTGPGKEGGGARRGKGQAGGTRVYTVGPDGSPSAVPVALGIGDGTYTQLLRGDLREGSVLITGETAKNGKNGNARTSAGGPPGMGMGGGFR